MKAVPTPSLSTAGPGTDGGSSSDAATWLLALMELVAVPAWGARPVVPLSAGRSYLGCSEAAWDAMLAAGLPVHDGGLDGHDLLNLAMAVGAGRSVPELYTRREIRFVTGSAGTWCEAKRWRVAVKLSCAASDGARSGDERWTVWPPLPWPGKPAAHDGEPRHVAGGAAEVAFDVDVSGRVGRLVSPRLIAVVRDYLAEGRRFFRLPDAVAGVPGWMQERRLFNCMTGSLELCERVRETGMHAAVRHGWLAGLVASPHAWLEVVDDDGCVKTIDIALHASAGQVYPELTAFQDFCLGSRCNRLIETACPTDRELVEHTCGSPAGQATTHVSIVCVG